MKRLTALIGLLAFVVFGLFPGCGDDGSGPGNVGPEIQSVAAEPDTVRTREASTLTCTASDADGDSLTYQWACDAGDVSGTGASVTWTAPAVAGVCTVSVTVSDGRGGTAGDEAHIKVLGGTFLVQTGGGLTAVDIDGNSFVVSTLTGPVEVLGDRIFVKASSHTIWEYDCACQLVGSVPIPDIIPYPYIHCVLPDGGFAWLDNRDDRIDITDAQGDHVIAIAMPETSPDNSQSVDGVVVGNSLIVSETGTRKLIEVDLATHAASIYKDLSAIGGWIGALAYSEGIYYICQCVKLHHFTEAGDAVELCTFDQGCLTGVTVVDDYLYIVINSPGEMYKINKTTGEKELFLSGLSYPQDIEYIPADMTPPPGRR